MKSGDVLRLRSFTHFGENGVQGSFTARRGEVYICLLLGIEPKEPMAEADKCDPVKALEALGFVQKPEAKP